MAETLTAHRRAVLEARVMERLGRLDDASLQRVADLILSSHPGGEPDGWRAGRFAIWETETITPPPHYPAAPLPSRGLTRRQVLAGTVIGGVAVAGAAAGAGAIGTVRGAAEATADLRAEAGTALERLQGLVALYQRLDDVGLDDVVARGVAAVAGALKNVEPLAARVRAGLERAETGFAELDQALVVLDEGLAAAEGAISRLADAVQALEDHLEAAGERVAPLAEALGGFFKNLIGKIPFGVGERILATIERVQTVVTTVPEAIAGVNTGLIEPVRRRFFPREDGTIRVELFDPLAAVLFDPVQRLLESVTILAERWQAELAAPVQQRIQARAEIREAIARYKADHDLT